MRAAINSLTKEGYTMHRVSILLTLLNLGLLAFTLSQRAAPVSADSTPAMLRGRGLEIVDSTGKLRASISVIPAGPARRADGSLSDQSGKIYPEAVVLRLIRPDGRPSVKIATSEQGSGIDLSGGIDPTYMILNADGGDTSVTLINKDGKRRVVDANSIAETHK